MLRTSENRTRVDDVSLRFLATALTLLTMMKFNRQGLIAILEVGESVEIKLSGKWKDGTAFEAYDVIRVIDPGT